MIGKADWIYDKGLVAQKLESTSKFEILLCEIG